MSHHSSASGTDTTQWHEKFAASARTARRSPLGWANRARLGFSLYALARTKRSHRSGGDLPLPIWVRQQAASLREFSSSYYYQGIIYSMWYRGTSKASAPEP